MAEKINQLVDRFIFEMDDKDKSILILKIFCGLCLFYSIFLISIFSFLPGLISERMPLSIFYKYLMFWGTFFVIFALMLSSVSIRGKENIPNNFSTLVVFSTGIMVLGLFHWVGAISSVVIVLLPMLLALSVPFFGKKSTFFIVWFHIGFLILLGLEISGVLSYAPLGINRSYNKIIDPGNVLLSITWVGFVSVMIYTFCSRVYARIDQVQKELQKQYELVKIEQSKNESLLANIMPQKVINDLRNSGRSEPENFESVTVFFSDIVGFTSISSELEPKYLIKELSDMFSNFDQIMEDHGCERIKTIGDAYLAVSGLTGGKAEENAEKMLQSSIKILDYLQQRPEKEGISWKIRVGIHSGKIVGGIVGDKKYIYDIFGDTVNTASRMESNSEIMKINISNSTHDLIQDKYNFTDRGEFQVKGKGKMKMYFVNYKTEA